MKTWDTVAIVGVGLIGGSIGLALRERKLAREIVGIGRRPTSLRTAKRVGAVTTTSTDLTAAVAQAQLVIICTPVDQIVEHARQIAWHAPAGAVITDVGSTKETIVSAIGESLRQHNPQNVSFVGSHPMAGSEKQGAKHARADLLEGRVVVVTPAPETPAKSSRVVGNFWRSLGANVITMSPQAHDQAVASVSHIPHLLASVVAATTRPDSLPLAAGGWLDTTRVAAGDPELWSQILSQNRFNILKSLDAVEKTLAEFRRALVYNDIPQLQRLLEAGKQIRDGQPARLNHREQAPPRARRKIRPRTTRTS